MNKILKEDFENILKDYRFDELKNKSFFITGATGFIGSQLIFFLSHLNKTRDFNIKIYGLARSKTKAEKLFGNSNDIKIIFADILNLPDINFNIDYIIHGASITGSKDFIEKSIDTIDIAINGTMNILNLAKSKDVKSMVYLSSMEAFGITEANREIKEEDLGYIDILSPRSSYSESKRMCECLCACYMHKFQLPVKIVRLAQTFGAGIDYNDTRIAAYFARCVLENADIVLKTEGKTKRPMLYSSDGISAIFTTLLRGKDGEVYTAANPSTFATVKDTAEMIINEIADNKIQLKFDLKEIPGEYAQNLNLNLNLNVDKLCGLGWSPKIGLKEAYERFISSLKF